MQINVGKLSGKPIYFNLLAVLILCCLGTVIYANILHSPFEFDDGFLVKNLSTGALTSLSSVWRYWTGRFLTLATFIVNYRIGGLNVFGYHLANLIIHLGVSSLVFWFTLLILSAPRIKDYAIAKHALPAALFTALIFLSHPLQTESVTYVFQRASCLSGFFYLASICFYLKSRLLREKTRLWVSLYILSLFSAVLSMFSKEQTITLPVMIFVCEFFFFSKRRYRYATPFLVLIPVTPILLFISKSVISRDFETLLAPQTYPELYYFLTQFRIMMTYIRLLFIPVNQNLDYDYQLIKTPFDPGALASLLVLIIIAIAAFKLFKKHRLISFSIFWFFITVLPESSLIHVKKDFIFEHWLYLPLAGYSLFLVSAAYQLLGKRNFKSMSILLLAVVTSYSALTYARNLIWKNDFTLWNDVIRKSPNKSRPYNNRGNAYLGKNKYDLAISDYNKAIEIDPRASLSYYNRGIAYTKKNDYDKAFSDYSQAINLDPNYCEAYNNRGIIYTRKGDYDKALSDYNNAIKLNPNYVELYSNRGTIYAITGQYGLALSDFSQAIRINPIYAKAYNSRGIVYETIGQYDKAISDYDKAIKIRPNDAEGYNNRGIAYQKKGDYDKAFSDHNQAIKINPNDAEGYSNRGVVYAKKGAYDKAFSDYSQAIKINPYFVEAYYNIGNLNRKKGRYDEAISDYDKAIEINPNYVEAYNNRGIAYDNKGQYDEAISDYDKAISINPNDAEGYNNRGVAYVKKGDYDEAISDYNKVIEINPKYASAYKNLIIVYFYKHEYDKAWENVRKAKLLGATIDPEVLEALTKASKRER